MARLKTPLEIYALLPRTNCGECGSGGCLAFAAAVLKEEARPSACPHLHKDVLSRLDGQIERQVNLETIQEEQLKALQERIAATDILARADSIGARKGADTLTIRCLGRDFEVDRRGMVASQCHTHAWFSIPLLDYVLSCKGAENSGRWVPLRDLESGRAWAALFERRCEKPLRHLADSCQEFFADLVGMFSGASASTTFGSDIAVVLYPLPRVPVLLCYWRAEEGMESKIHVFFDERAEKNLPIESLFTLGTGLVRMFEKIMLRHAAGAALP